MTLPIFVVKRTCDSAQKSRATSYRFETAVKNKYDVPNGTQLPERYLEKLGARGALSIDGKVEHRSLSEQQTITIQPGVGPHSARIRPE